MNRNGSGKDVIEPEDDVAIQVKEWSHPFQTPGWISHWVVQPMAGWAVRPMACVCVGQPRAQKLGSCRSAI